MAQLTRFPLEHLHPGTSSLTHSGSLVIPPSLKREARKIRLLISRCKLTYSERDLRLFIAYLGPCKMIPSMMTGERKGILSTMLILPYIAGVSSKARKFIHTQSSPIVGLARTANSLPLSSLRIRIPSCCHLLSQDVVGG
jgi:hypothetical protein